jgi:hypothetical protein
MSGITGTHARAVADLAEGHIMAAVEIASPPERVFRAIARMRSPNGGSDPGYSIRETGPAMSAEVAAGRRPA